MRFPTRQRVIGVLLCLILMFSFSACVNENNLVNETSNAYELEILEEDDEQFESELTSYIEYKNNNVYHVQEHRSRSYCDYCNAFLWDSNDWEKGQAILTEIFWYNDFEPELSHSEIGRIRYDVVFDFLSPRLTLFFDLGFIREESFYDAKYILTFNSEWISIDEVPETLRLIYTSSFAIYDIERGRIAYTPFLRKYEGYTRDIYFSLYSLDNSYIPKVKIRSAAFDSCAMGTRLFSLRNGEYVPVAFLMWESRFFRNKQNKLFLIERDGMGPWYIISLITFYENEVHIKRICDDCIPDPSTLMRVRSLTTLEEKITDIVRSN